MDLAYPDKKWSRQNLNAVSCDDLTWRSPDPHMADLLIFPLPLQYPSGQLLPVPASYAHPCFILLLLSTIILLEIHCNLQFDPSRTDPLQ